MERNEMQSNLTIGMFFREISESPSLKFSTAWASVGILVLPLAAMVTFGLSEKIAFSLLLAAVLPVQYLTFRLLRKPEPEADSRLLVVDDDSGAGMHSRSVIGNWQRSLPEGRTLRSETYCVFIASSSDLAEERQAAKEAIYEWNAQHAVAESAVLLPVMWETHARPQLGGNSQEVVDHQFAEDCDILIGMFWTRLGTDTGVAGAGTMEEIGQFVAAGKRALLYFSNRPFYPSADDLRQYEKLRDFKDGIYKWALTGSFDGVDELRRKLLRDLLQEVRELKTSSHGSALGNRAKRSRSPR